MRDAESATFTSVRDRFSSDDTETRLAEAKEQYIRDQLDVSRPYSEFGDAFWEEARSIMSEPVLLGVGLVIGVLLEAIVCGFIQKLGWFEGSTLWPYLVIFPFLLTSFLVFLASYWSANHAKEHHLKDLDAAIRTAEKMSARGLLANELEKAISLIERLIQGDDEPVLVSYSAKLTANADALDAYADTLRKRKDVDHADRSDALDLIAEKTRYLRSLVEEGQAYIAECTELANRRKAWNTDAGARESALTLLAGKEGVFEHQLISEEVHEITTGCLEIEADAASLLQRIDDLILRMQKSEKYVPEDSIED